MKKLIVFWGGLIGLAFLALMLFGIQMGIHSSTKGDGAKVAVNAPCTVQDAIVVDGRRNDNVALKLDCQGRKMVIEDPKVVASYLKNPGLLICTIYESGKIKCQERKLDKPVDKN